MTCFFLFIQPFLEFRIWKRLIEVVALRERTAVASQHIYLILCLYALGDALQSELLRHCDEVLEHDAAGAVRIIRVGREKAPVELQHVPRYVAYKVQRELSYSEVVHRGAYALLL